MVGDNSVADASRKQVREFRKATEAEIKKVVQESNDKVEAILQNVEDNYYNAVNAQIEYFKKLLENTDEKMQPMVYARAKVMHEIYTKMLENFQISKKPTWVA